MKRNFHCTILANRGSRFWKNFYIWKHLFKIQCLNKSVKNNSQLGDWGKSEEVSESEDFSADSNTFFFFFCGKGEMGLEYRTLLPCSH